MNTISDYGESITIFFGEDMVLNHHHLYTKYITVHNMKCLSIADTPIMKSLTLKHREILQKAHRILSKRRVKIHPKFTKLITSLRTATSKQGDSFDLDKTQASESDVLDAFIASMMPIKFANE